MMNLGITKRPRKNGNLEGNLFYAENCNPSTL